MITKGIIEKIDGYKAKVRLPIYDDIPGSKDSTKSDDLRSAAICSIANIDTPIGVGDIVYVGFEDNDKNKPVILGHLYKAKKNETSPSLYLGMLTTSSTTKLNNQTYIGDITPAEISRLKGVEENIQEQINRLKDKVDNPEEYDLSNFVTLTGSQQTISSDKVFTGTLAVLGSAANHRLKTRGISGIRDTNINEDAPLYLNYDGVNDLASYKARPVYLGGLDSNSIAVRQDMLDKAIADLINKSPETLNTLQEIADWISKDEDNDGVPDAPALIERVMNIESNYVTKNTNQTITGNKDFTGEFRINGAKVTYDKNSDKFIFGEVWNDVGAEILETRGFVFKPIDDEGKIVDETLATSYMVGDDSDTPGNGYDKGTSLKSWNYGDTSLFTLQYNIGNTFQVIPMVGVNNIDISNAGLKEKPYLKIVYRTKNFVSDDKNYITCDNVETEHTFYVLLTPEQKTYTFGKVYHITADTSTIQISTQSQYFLTDPNGTYPLGTSIKEISIDCYKFDEPSADLNIPTQYKNKPVIKIGNNAFSGENCKTLTIPYTIKYIGEYAFNNTVSLETINIDSNRISLGQNNNAFYNCGKSQTLVVNFGDNVKRVANMLFCPRMSLSFEEHCKVITANLNKVEEIGIAGFGMCFELANIDTTKIKFIDNLGFAACSYGLKNIDLMSIEAINSSAFFLGSSLKNLFINGKCEVILNSTSQPMFSSTPTVYTDASSMPEGWDPEAFSNATMLYNKTHDNYLSETSVSTVSAMSIKTEDKNKLKPVVTIKVR